MRYIILLLLIFNSCTKQKQESKEYILLVDGSAIVEKAELNSKKIGYCPKGEVTELVDEVTLDVRNIPSEGGRMYHSFWKVNCKNQLGFLDFDKNLKYELNKDKDYLIQNKQYIYDFYEFSDDITGYYYGNIEFIGNISRHYLVNDKVLFTNVLVNPMYAEELNLVKIKEKQYLLFNHQTILLVSKVENGIYMEVIRGNEDFQTLDKKKLTKIIRGVPNYPDPDEFDEPTKKTETENKFHK